MASRNRNQGELESAVLGVLWDSLDAEESNGDLTSQEILERLSPAGELALTTVLTVLSRLVDKGLVKREAGTGRALRFSAATTRAQHDAQLLLKIFEGSDNPMLAFSHFAQALDGAQLAKLKQSLNRD
jgi:predicted transcriptional regulator